MALAYFGLKFIYNKDLKALMLLERFHILTEVFSYFDENRWFCQLAEKESPENTSHVSQDQLYKFFAILLSSQRKRQYLVFLLRKYSYISRNMFCYEECLLYCCE